MNVSSLYECFGFTAYKALYKEQCWCFFQVSFILGIPHRYKRGAAEDDVASSLQLLNQPPDA